MAPPPLKGIKVLVVEDDEATRYILSRQLAQTGAIVKVDEDAERALSIPLAARHAIALGSQAEPISPATRGINRVPACDIDGTAVAAPPS